MTTPEDFCPHGRPAGAPCARCTPVTVPLGSTDFSMPQERVLVGNFSIDTSLQTVQVGTDRGPCACGRFKLYPPHIPPLADGIVHLERSETPDTCEIVVLRAEVERLKAESQERLARWLTLEDTVERLTRERDEAREQVKAMLQRYEYECVRAGKAAGKRDRLAAALRGLLNWWDGKGELGAHDALTQARAALAEVDGP